MKIIQAIAAIVLVGSIGLAVYEWLNDGAPVLAIVIGVFALAVLGIIANVSEGKPGIGL